MVTKQLEPPVNCFVADARSRMRTFQIADKFLLDGEPFTILSGAIHFFRVHPSDWHHSLYNLKAMGFNTVETYVPWNAHEPRPGEFNFSDGLDLGAFLDEAAELGLYAIVRPTPYICAEWEFGGMPPWLLADRSMRPRSSSASPRTTTSSCRSSSPVRSRTAATSS